MSDKAKFLIDEYKSCLIRQDLFDSPDADDSKYLLESDVKCHQAIEHLKQTTDKLKEYAGIINRHHKAFTELDIKKSKTHSKGHSATILFFKELVQPEFNSEQWYSGGRSGCAYFELLAVPNLANEVTGQAKLAELSAPYIMFYVDRPNYNKSAISVYGGTIGGDKELKKPMQAFVKELCHELRKHFRDNPTTASFVSTKENTNNIASIPLVFSGINNPEDDTETLLSQHKLMLTEASRNMFALKEAIEIFETSIVKDLLSKHLLGIK